MRTLQTQSSVELSSDTDTTYNHHLNQAANADTTGLPVSSNSYEKLQFQDTYDYITDSAANTTEYANSLIDDNKINSLNAGNKLSRSSDDGINKSVEENFAYDYVVPEMHHSACDYPSADNQYLTIIG